jgi:anti-anti-sigma factor
MPLEMNSKIDGATARLVLAGELDGASAPSVRDAVEQILGRKVRRLVLEVERLNFMASAGLRIIIFAKQRQPDLKIFVVRPQAPLVETLKKTGFYDAVYVQDTDVLDEAAAG